MQQPQAAAGAQLGQGLVEYALILLLVAIAVVLVLVTMGGQLENIFNDVVATWPH